MIEYKTGDLLAEDAEALVNTVNCVGFMGRGFPFSAQDDRARERSPSLPESAAASQRGFLAVELQ